MAKRNKRKKITADKTFTRGPFHFAQYGNNVLYSSTLSKENHDKAQEKLAAEYPVIVNKINNLVSEIAGLVSKLRPDMLLHRAYWDMAQRHMQMRAEVELDIEDGISMRMLDYIQSIIASTTPSKHQEENISEENWDALRQKVSSLFSLLNLDYQMCRTAINKIQEPNLSYDIEQFVYNAQMFWCNVRGHRYQIHELEYLENVFLPYSQIFEEIFDITSREFIDEIIKIWNSLSFGIQNLFNSWLQFQEDASDAIDSIPEGDEIFAISNPEQILAKVIEERGWKARSEELIGGLLMDMFDVQKLTKLPPKLLDELSWAPGEEKDFFAPGEYCGWPLRIWPIFKRPFLKLNGHYYCFHLHSLFDHLYRVMQKTILRHKPTYTNTWQEIQKNFSENLALKYLQKILPGANSSASVYYKWYPNNLTKRKEWCETDGIVIYDNHLIIIECKAGSFTYTSPTTDFLAFIESLKNLVLNPTTQGKRFLEYLNSGDEVSIFDENHKEIKTISVKKLSSVTICAITLDPFTEIAAQVQHLKKAGIDIGEYPIWSISLDDLRTYSDLFTNPLLFIHFLKHRLKAFKPDYAYIYDELDHLGLYLQHNDYSAYTEQIRKQQSAATITFGSYRLEIDKFFYERMYDPTLKFNLNTNLPPQIIDIIEFLSNCEKPKRSDVAIYLLDLSGHWKNQIAQSIAYELNMHPTDKRTKPISVYSESNLTIYCCTPWAPRQTPQQTIFHSYATMLFNNANSMLQLELTYNTNNQLEDVDWLWINRADIPSDKIQELQKYAETIRQQRIQYAMKQNGKIERNEPCPCGSGKKYKKCCLNKNPRYMP